jgi:hypothetical protein
VQKRKGVLLVPVLFLAAVIGVVAVIAGLAATARLLGIGKTEDRYRDNPVVLQALQDLASYKAASGQFQIVADLEEDVKLVPSFLAGERTYMVAAGSVDAEVDFSSLGPEAVQVTPDRRGVTITLPAAQLSETRIDNDNTYVAERQRGLINRLGEALSSNPGDDAKLYQRAEDEMKAAATQSGLTGRAEDNTRDMLTALLTSLGFDDVTIVFQPPQS